MGYRIDWREPSREERLIAKPPRLPPAAGAMSAAALRFVLMLVLCFCALMAFAGIVVPLTMKLDWDPTVPAWTTPVLIVVLWGPVILVPAVIAVNAYRRHLRSATARLRDAHSRVQVIEVRQARFFTLVDDKLGPTYLFDLGGQTLVIAGSALAARPEVFGLPSIEAYLDALEVEDDLEDVEFPDVLFPNSDFVLHRLPHSGRILAIEPKGERGRPSGRCRRRRCRACSGDGCVPARSSKPQWWIEAWRSCWASRCLRDAAQAARASPPAPCAPAPTRAGPAPVRPSAPTADGSASARRAA